MTWFYFVLECVFFQKATEGGVQTGKILWWNSEKHHFLVPKNSSKFKLKCLETAQIRNVTLLSFFYHKRNFRKLNCLDRKLLSGQHTQNYTNLKSFSTQKVFYLEPSVRGDFDFVFIKDDIVKASTKIYKNPMYIYVGFLVDALTLVIIFRKQLLSVFWTHFEIIEIPLEVWCFL